MTSLRKLQIIWHQELVEWFEKEGIDFCERCKSRWPEPDISHGKKRRFLITRDLYFFAVKLCRACHNWAEYGKEPGKPYEKATHERLERIHRELIAQRWTAQVSA